MRAFLCAFLLSCLQEAADGQRLSLIDFHQEAQSLFMYKTGQAHAFHSEKEETLRII